MLDTAKIMERVFDLEGGRILLKVITILQTDGRYWMSAASILCVLSTEKQTAEAAVHPKQEVTLT